MLAGSSLGEEEEGEAAGGATLGVLGALGAPNLDGSPKLDSASPSQGSPPSTTKDTVVTRAGSEGGASESGAGTGGGCPAGAAGMGGSQEGGGGARQPSAPPQQQQAQQPSMPQQPSAQQLQQPRLLSVPSATARSLSTRQLSKVVSRQQGEVNTLQRLQRAWVRRWVWKEGWWGPGHVSWCYKCQNMGVHGGRAAAGACYQNLLAWGLLDPGHPKLNFGAAICQPCLATNMKNTHAVVCRNTTTTPFPGTECSLLNGQHTRRTAREKQPACDACHAPAGTP